MKDKRRWWLGKQVHGVYGVWSRGSKTKRKIRGPGERLSKRTVKHVNWTEDAIDNSKWRKLKKDVRWSGWVWVGECFFWYRPTRVVPDQGPLNGGVCVCVKMKDNNVRTTANNVDKRDRRVILPTWLAVDVKKSRCWATASVFVAFSRAQYLYLRSGSVSVLFTANTCMIVGPVENSDMGQRGSLTGERATVPLVTYAVAKKTIVMSPWYEKLYKTGRC